MTAPSCTKNGYDRLLQRVVQRPASIIDTKRGKRAYAAFLNVVCEDYGICDERVRNGRAG